MIDRPPSRSPRLPGARRLAALLFHAAALVAVLLPVRATAQYHELETDDLRLVWYGPALGFIAPYTVQCFENSMRFHRRLWGYAPSERVNVILDDFTDYGNAGVWANPRNSMSLHVAPSNFVYETGPSNERINFTMNHEIVHVVALDQAAGSDRIFRGLFHGKVRETAEHPETILYGHLTLPRRAAPRWYHEGIAVFMETWMAGGLGRAQGPYDEMVFRSMVRDSTPIYDPLGLETEGTHSDFQIGVNSYLYGTRFMSYLAWEYGPEKVIEWVGRGPGSHRGWTDQFRAVFGRSLEQGWRDWVAWEHDFQRANLMAVRRYPLTGSRDLARGALGSVSRAFVDSTRGRLYAAVYYPGALPSIAALDLATGKLEALAEVKGPALYFVASLAHDPDGDRLFYTTDNNEWRDLNVLDLKTGRSRRLMRDARIGDLAFNRQDHSLWGVRHFNGISTIVRLPEPWTDYRSVFSYPYGRDVYDLDIAPDGSRIAMSMAEISGRQTLRLLSVPRLMEGDTTSRTLFDFGVAIPTSFTFSPDGRRLYGSSYYTGVSNIFRYDLDADSMDVITNAETGFFRPVPLGGDSLVAFRYSGKGFVPAMVADRPLTDVSAITFLGQKLAEKHPVVKSWVAPPPSRIDADSLITYRGAYRAAGAIGLTTAYPIVQGYKAHASPGVRLDFSDPVGVHHIDVAVTVSADDGIADDERLHAKAGYRHFDVEAHAFWNPASFYDLVGPTKRSRKGYGGDVRYTRSLIRDTPRALDLRLGASMFGDLERLPDAQNVEVGPGFDVSTSSSLSLEYKNMRASIGAIDYENGWQGRLDGSLTGVRFTRDGHTTWRGFPAIAGGLDAGTPILIPNASVWLRNQAGVAPGDREDPFANFFFGGFGNNWIDRESPRRYRDYESFPGAGINEIAGTNFVKSMVEWNLPAVRFRRAGTLGFHAAWARLSLFASGLGTNVDRGDLRRFAGNAGAQADVRFNLFARQPLTLSAGYARAYEKRRLLGDEWMVSLKVL